jgi:hypothetical protein
MRRDDGAIAYRCSREIYPPSSGPSWSNRNAPLLATTETSWLKGKPCPSASAQGTHESGLAPPDRRRPGAGLSHQATEQNPNPRVRVPPRPLPPSPTLPAYWPLEPSDPTISPRGHRETPYAILSLGAAPYPVTLNILVLSSLSLREGEEGVAAAKGVVEVAIAEEDDDDEPIEVIPVLESLQPRLAYKQTVWIRISPRGSTHRNPSTNDQCKGGQLDLT